MKDFFVPKDLLLFSNSMGMNSDFSVRGFSAGEAEDEGTLTVSAAPTANIEVVGTSAGGRANGGVITLGLPEDIQAGDICILAGALAVASTGYSSFFTATGFSYVGGVRGDGATDITLVVRYRVLDGSETLIEINSGLGRPSAAVLYTVRGVNNITPFDVASVFASGINTGVANSPPITPITDNAMVVIVGASSHMYITSQNISAPSGFTALARMSQTGSSFNSATVGVASAIVQASTIDPSPWGGLATDSYCAWAAATLALRPA